MWRIGMNLSGRHRVKTFGTFGVTVLGSTGACLINPISPTTTTITYGPLSSEGEIDVRLIFDHRVLDGLTAALVLKELETVLKQEIVQEMKSMEQK